MLFRKSTVIYSFTFLPLISHRTTTHLLLLSSSLVSVVLLRRFSSKKRSNLRTRFHPAFILQVPWSLPPPKRQFPSPRKKMATRVTLKRKQMLIVYSNFVKWLFCELKYLITTTFFQFSGGMGIYLSLWIFTVTSNLCISFVVISILLFLRAM